ncbi:hypothetical protein [Candidatus Albibeggiatoa sp. nov. BB20]|uniref:hypothetical protein n=1 Tax=Candidatus Albibeggiatoa sp. nov. BB20 TaxID=3162723 RepID=UPI0033653C93
MLKLYHIKLCLHLGLVLTLLGAIGFPALSSAYTNINYGQPAQLPLPSNLPLADYEAQLYRWLMERRYAQLGWAVDKEVRDTGSFVEGHYYGTHPAVRIYYSPEVIQWLVNGRKGKLPDGAMIIKEMFSPPAVLYQELEHAPQYKNAPEAYEAMLTKLISAWTVMIRDSEASADGWFWGGPGAPKEGESIKAAIKRQIDDYSHELYSSFGGMCLRCHASAERESTFITLQNIKGFLPEEAPLRFHVDNSWRTQAHFEKYPLSLIKNDPFVKTHFMLEKPQLPWTADDLADYKKIKGIHIRDDMSLQKLAPEGHKTPNSAFLETFKAMPIITKDAVKKFPSWWADHVVPMPNSHEPYITSSNCLGCHGGLGGSPFGVDMFVKTGSNYGEGYNISEFGEWRWSPMGLAGRDPIFHAQLESEMAYLERDGKEHPEQVVGSLKANQAQLTNTCLSCHGAMGQRSLAMDAQRNTDLDPNFKLEYFYLTETLGSRDTKPDNYAYHKYGELAREGISCNICHHIDAPNAEAIEAWNPPERWLGEKADKKLAYALFHHSTGRFKMGDPDVLYGPFKNVAEKPMQHALGMTPEYNPYIKDSQMCGTCHTINLPDIGSTKDKHPILTQAATNPLLSNYNHSIEQATFLEWQNSIFAQKGNTKFASCQDCHMPSHLDPIDAKNDVQVKDIKTKIATIQDADYPTTENTLPVEDIDIPVRDEYHRHSHVGLNAFLLEIFEQFPEVLGVHKQDPMTFAKNGPDFTIKNMLYQAEHQTADVGVKINSIENGKLLATVTVKNKVGHRFPSGVAFRRAFLEFQVLEGDTTIWASGRTNAAGVIIDGEGKPLKTEFLDQKGDDGKYLYQPHYQKITCQDQVQIYEELNQNSDHEFTTSFVHRVHHVKDNRLLPTGWQFGSSFKEQGELMVEFMEATDPIGTQDDPDYRSEGLDFPGQDMLQYEVSLPEGTDTKALSVKVSLYYQAIPPYWLNHRFKAAPDKPATQRLYYLTSHLNLLNTPLKNWKLLIRSMSAQVANQ